MEAKKKEERNKYGSLCSHDFQKSLTNEIELVCLDRPEITHKISQYGKICNKCSQIIRDSVKFSEKCLVCSGQLENYLQQREICPHEDRQYSEVHLRCLKTLNQNHEVPFKSKACRQCVDKIRAAFMSSKTCKVCEGKQQDLLKDIEKVFISPAYSYIKNIIGFLSEKKKDENTFRLQIEAGCKATPKVENPSSEIPNEIKEQYEKNDEIDYHLSKRYKLYPRCQKHRKNPINVCNLCLVGLLNLGCCPYGCESLEEISKPKKETQVKIYETGFLQLYPTISKQSYFLEMFVFRQIEEKGRLDRWEAKIKKITPKSQNQVNYLNKFALYGASVNIDQQIYIMTGGMVGKQIQKKEATTQSIAISLSNEAKQFQIKELTPMNEARSSHALVYHKNRKMIFAIGGFRNQMCLNSTQVYSFDSQKWHILSPLNIQRSKPSAFIFKDHVYVTGGLSSNQNFWEILCQRLNYETYKWQNIEYRGYDNPSLSGITCSTVLQPFQESQNILLFGGCTGNQYLPSIQQFSVKDNKFQLNPKGSFDQMKFARSNCVLGLLANDTILCFGGILQHESLMSLDGLKIRYQKDDLSPVFVLDEIQVGSYRFILRQDAKSVYDRLYENLTKEGLVSSEKLEQAGQNLEISPYNCHLLERLWYSMGKTYVWVKM